MKPIIAKALRFGNWELRPWANKADMVLILITEKRRRFFFPITYIIRYTSHQKGG